MATEDNVPAWMGQFGAPVGSTSSTAPKPNLREKRLTADITQSGASAASSAAAAERSGALLPKDVRLREAQAQAAELKTEQARIALEKVKAQSYPSADSLREAQDKLLMEVRNLAEVKRLSQSAPGASGFLYSTMSNISGSPAASVDSLLAPVKANTAFDALKKMRQESPTGSALGNVTEKELELLFSSEGSINPKASDPTFQRSMDELIANRVKAAGRIGVDAGALAEALGSENVEAFAPNYEAYRFRPSDEKLLAEYVKQSKKNGTFDPTDYAAYMAQAYQAATGRAPDEGFVANALKVGQQIGTSKDAAVGPVDYSIADETARKYLVTKGKGTAPAGLSWGETLGGAAINLLPSVFEMAADTVKALTINLPETIEGVVDIVGGATGLSDDPEAWNAVKEYYTSRYGSMEGFKKALRDDPVSILADVAGIASGGTLLVAKGVATTSKVARVAALANAAKKMEGFAATAAKFDPLAITAKTVEIGAKSGARAAEAVGVGVPAKLAGVTGVDVKQGFKAGQEASPEFVEQMRGTGDVVDPVRKAKDALGELYQRRSSAYTRRMASIKQSPETVNFVDVDDALKKTREIGEHKGIDISSAADVWNEVYDKVAEFRDLNLNSVEDFDAMKRAVGNVRDQYQRGTPQYKVANDAYKAIDKTITAKAPIYATVMKDYRLASDVLADVESSIASGAASLDTTLGKLRRSASGVGPRGTTVLDVLEGTKAGKGLGNMLAGQAFSGKEARGLSPSISTATALATGSPEALVGAVLSPRLLGENVYNLGQKYGTVERAVAGLPGMDRVSSTTDLLRKRGLPVGASVLRTVNPALIQPQVNDFSFSLPSEEEQKAALAARYSPAFPTIPLSPAGVPSLSELRTRYPSGQFSEGPMPLIELQQRYAQPPEEEEPQPREGFAMGGRVFAPSAY